MNDTEEDNYKKADEIAEKRMLDNLTWVLRFMRNYEEKKENERQRRIISEHYR